MNKQQLASKIWQAANKMRSKIEANVYKDYILGFIFYKFLSDKEEMFFLNEGMLNEEMSEYLVEEETDTVEHAQKNLGYFIPYNYLFSTWIKHSDLFSFGVVKDALSSFSRLISKTHKKVFGNIFKTLDNGLSSLGYTDAARTKAVSELINLIVDIPTDGKQDYDVLGFVYEFLISNFAANAGKKAGEFYTPHEVSVLMSEIIAEHLKDRDHIEIYDPTSGSGSLLINIGKSVAKHMENKNNIKYYAQELIESTFNLTRMNLVMRGILPDNIYVRNGDTLEDDWPLFDEEDKIHTYHTLYVDAVVSNPPYSQSWNPKDKEAEPRYKNYGLAPKSKADYAFLLHDLYHIKPDGIMTIVLPHGVLFRGGSEEEIRKKLIENNKIDAIIGLPVNIFFGTGIPTIVMVLKQKKDNTDVLIIDASKGFTKVGKNNKLRECDIRKIVDTIKNRISIPKYSKVVSKDEIRSNEYNLNIPRYVDSSEESETYDIYATMFGGIPNCEIDRLDKYWTVLSGLKDSLFQKVNDEYSKCEVHNVKEIIEVNESVKLFEDSFKRSFSDFDTFLKVELIDNLKNINVTKEENIITLNIFDRLKNIKLIDKYSAYQLFVDNWNNITQDIETIQNDGFEVITKVEPNIVLKKKDGQEIEVTEGYKGTILPFELVQKTLLKNKFYDLKRCEDEIVTISSTLNEILESFNEEDRGTFINNDGTSFVASEIAKLVKSYKGLRIEDDSLEDKIIKVNELLLREKPLKKKLKAKQAELHELTKTTIENMSIEDALSLLYQKWISPIVSSINELPKIVIKDLTSKVKKLSEKYNDTLISIDEEIRTTSKELSDLIDNLTGPDFDMKGLQEFKKMLGGK